MTDIKNNIISSLRQLDMSDAEAKLYLALLEKPMSHLELSRKTRINRTKVYRLADNLKLRGLLMVDQRDDGKFLTAVKPDNLEIELLDKENRLKQQKKVFNSVAPVLDSILKGRSLNEHTFTVSTYEGTSGLKQMLWNELKTKGEICIFSHDTLDTLAGKTWAEKFRTRFGQAKVPHRSLENNEAGHVLEFTESDEYREVYDVRYLPRSVFDIQQELTIHDDTVSIYNWKGKEDSMRVGLEIKNQDFANFMQAIFDEYWGKGLRHTGEPS